MEDEADAQPCSADLFRALADPTRRSLLDELRERGDQSLFQLCTRLAMKHQVTSSRQAVPRHLAVLEGGRDGAVAAERADPAAHALHRPAALEPRALAPAHGGGTLTTPPAPRIVLTSIHVDDQAKALAFSTNVLGFQPKNDVPLGEHRWLTVVSPHDPDGIELVLEPNDHPAALAYQEALTVDGIPITAFAVDDVRVSVAALEQRGVRVVQPPTEMGRS